MALRPTTKELVEQILSTSFSPCKPFRGDLPFEIVLSEGSTPRAIVTDELWNGQATKYQIALTCLSENEANRFVYQYAHEVCHFYLTPVEHPVLEVIAVAVSLFVLRECGRKWRANRWGDYSTRFDNYVEQVRKNCYSTFNLDPLKANQSLRWMKKGSNEINSTLVNDHHLVIAFQVTAILERFPNSWECLTTLHRCLIDDEDGNHYVDFRLWRTTYHSDKLATEIAGLLTPLFDINPTGRVSATSSILSLLRKPLECCRCFPILNKFDV